MKCEGLCSINLLLCFRCQVEAVRELVHKQCGTKGPKKISSVTEFCPLPKFKRNFLWDPKYVKYVETKVVEHGAVGVKLWWDERPDHLKHLPWGQAGSITPFHKLAMTACPLTVDVLASGSKFAKS